MSADVQAPSIALRRWKKALRWTLLALGLLLALVVVVMLVPAGRNAVLRQALAAADKSLPGRLEFEHAAWTGPLRWEISGLHWSSADASLAWVRRCELEVSLSDLWRRDLVVRTLAADLSHVNIAAITAAMETDGVEPATTPSPDVSPAAVPFLREGAMARLPSVAILSAEVFLDSLVLSPDQWLLGLNLQGNLDLQPATAPAAAVMLQGRDGAGQWAIERAELRLRPSSYQAEGNVDVSVTDIGLVRMHLTPSGTRETQAVLAVAEIDSLLQWQLQPMLDGQQIVGLHVEGDVRVPGTRALSALPLLTPGLQAAPDLAGTGGKARITLRSQPEPSVSASLQLDANAWLEGLQAQFSAHPGHAALDTLQLRLPGLMLTSQAQQSDSLRVEATLQVNSSQGLRTLLPEVDLPADLGAHLTLRASGVPDELSASVSGDVFASEHGLALTALANIKGDNITARVSPVQIRAGRRATPPPPSATLNLELALGDSVVTATKLRFQGDYGEGRLSGRVGFTAAGSANLQWNLPRLPAGLAKALALPDSVLQSIREAWPRDENVGLVASASSDRTGDGRLRWTIDGNMILPRPSTFQALLGNSSQLDDLGSLQASFRGEGSDDFTLSPLRVFVDFSATDWIEAARVELEGIPGDLPFTTQGNLLDALTWQADGQLRGANTQIAARLSALPKDWLQRLRPEAAENLTKESPVEARLRYRADSLVVDVSLPQGLRSSQLDLEQLELSAQAPLENGRPASVSYQIDARGPELQVRHEGRVAGAELTELTSDRLYVELRGRGLETTKPLRLRLDRERSALHVESLDLAGSLGSLQAQGVVGRDVAKMKAQAELVLPPRPSELNVPDSLWPSGIRLDLQATSPRDLLGGLAVDGLTLDGQKPLDLTATATADSVLAVELKVGDDTQTFLTGRGRIPFDTGGGDLLSQPLELDLTSTGLPLPAAWLESNDRSLRIDGALSVRGTPREPRANGQLAVSFPRWPGISTWTMRIEATVEPSPGIFRADWFMDRANDTLLSGRAQVPLAFESRPGLDSTRGILVTTEAKALPLRDLDELLPSDIGMDGTLGLSLSATGDAEDPQLEGRLTLVDAKTTLADGSRMTAQGRVDLGGRASLPVLRGTLRIQNGVLVVPDPPPHLLPTQGSSLLWEAHATADSTLATEPAAKASVTLPMDVDITVDVPSGLWVRGKGLEMELAGQLRFTQGASDSIPSIIGDLSAVRGTFAFLGHDFALERGTVSFFGNALTPELDARLATTVEGVRIRVIVAGTPTRPELRLESDPSMTEGDITSLLLFGRTLDQLDDDQLGLVGSRTNSIARSFGIAAVQQQLRQRIGVDLVQIDTGSGNDSGSVLVGKYLSPNVLLKYKQILEETTTFLINLEYTLTRQLRLETSYGRRIQSGAEINWTQDY